jgi:hypothetical protein
MAALLATVGFERRSAASAVKTCGEGEMRPGEACLGVWLGVRCERSCKLVFAVRGGVDTVLSDSLALRDFIASRSAVVPFCGAMCSAGDALQAVAMERASVFCRELASSVLGVGLVGSELPTKDIEAASLAAVALPGVFTATRGDRNVRSEALDGGGGDLALDSRWAESAVKRAVPLRSAVIGGVVARKAPTVADDGGGGVLRMGLASRFAVSAVKRVAVLTRRGDGGLNLGGGPDCIDAAAVATDPCTCRTDASNLGEDMDSGEGLSDVMVGPMSSTLPSVGSVWMDGKPAFVFDRGGSLPLDTGDGVATALELLSDKGLVAPLACCAESLGGDGSAVLALACDAIVSAGGLRLIGLFNSSAMGDGILGVTDRCPAWSVVDGCAEGEDLFLPLTALPPLPTGPLESALEGGETDFLAGLDAAMGGCGVGTEIFGGECMILTLVRVANGGGVDVDREDPEATFLIELESDTGEGVRCGMRFEFALGAWLARPCGKDIGPVMVCGTANDWGSGAVQLASSRAIGAGPVTSVSGVGGGKPCRSASDARR